MDVLATHPKLSKFRTDKLLGHGGKSAVFDVGHGVALKLSAKPCFPEKMETFDLPIYDKGAISKKIYWCTMPKAENYLKSRITQAEMQKLIQ